MLNLVLTTRCIPCRAAPGAGNPKYNLATGPIIIYWQIIIGEEIM
jgi:hypothetical protein